MKPVFTLKVYFDPNTKSYFFYCPEREVPVDQIKEFVEQIKESPTVKEDHAEQS